MIYIVSAVATVKWKNQDSCVEVCELNPLLLPLLYMYRSVFVNKHRIKLARSETRQRSLFILVIARIDPQSGVWLVDADEVLSVKLFALEFAPCVLHMRVDLYLCQFDG